MNKKRVVSTALAGLLMFNTLSSCVSSVRSNIQTNISLSEELDETYETRNIYVGKITLITGEEELILVDSGNYDIFSNVYYKNVLISNKAKLVEYLNVDELKESFTKEELRSILDNIRKDFHGMEFNNDLSFPYEVFVSTPSDEVRYDSRSLGFLTHKNDKDQSEEIYLCYISDIVLGVSCYTEFFTDTYYGVSGGIRYSINDFIPTNYTKRYYTKEELKALLTFVRDVYHNNLKLYGKDNTLTLK